jgi:hypothetical protein
LYILLLLIAPIGVCISAALVYVIFRCRKKFGVGEKTVENPFGKITSTMSVADKGRARRVLVYDVKELHCTRELARGDGDTHREGTYDGVHLQALPDKQGVKLAHPESPLRQLAWQDEGERPKALTDSDTPEALTDTARSEPQGHRVEQNKRSNPASASASVTARFAALFGRSQPRTGRDIEVREVRQTSQIRSPEIRRISAQEARRASQIGVASTDRGSFGGASTDSQAYMTRPEKPDEIASPFASHRFRNDWDSGVQGGISPPPNLDFPFMQDPRRQNLMLKVMDL